MHVDGKAKVVNGLGEFYFTIDADPETGSRTCSPARPRKSSPLPHACRPLGQDRCAYSFPMFKGARLPDELFESQYESLRRGVRQHPPALRPASERPTRSDDGPGTTSSAAATSVSCSPRQGTAGTSFWRSASSPPAISGYPPVLRLGAVPLYEEDGLRMGELAQARA